MPDELFATRSNAFRRKTVAQTR